MIKIYLTGTFHFNSLPDIFSKTVQDELEKITDIFSSHHPNKIALEFPRRCQEHLDEFYKGFDKEKISENIHLANMKLYGNTSSISYANEIVQIGFRLASKLGLPRVYGIDEDMPLSNELFETVSPYVQNEIERHQKAFSEAFSSENDILSKYRIHNSREYILSDNEIYNAVNKVNIKAYEGSCFVSQWYERNLKIFSNLQNICEDGDRVFVFIGSSHLKILGDLIDGAFDMKLEKAI